MYIGGDGQKTCLDFLKKIEYITFALKKEGVHVMRLAHVTFLLFAVLMACAPEENDGKKSVSNISKDSVGVEKLDIGGENRYDSLKGQTITVALPRSESDFNGFLEKKTREFEKISGIRVNLMNKGRKETTQLITNSFERGDSVFDVVELDYLWVRRFLKRGWIESLDGFVNAEILDGMVPGLLDKFSVDGHLFGVTWNNDTRFFMYNKSLLKQAGIEKVPETWQDFVDADKAFREQGILVNSMMDSYADNRSGCSELFFVVASFGGHLLDDEGVPVMADDLKTEKAFQFLVKVFDMGMMDKNSLISDLESVANVFCMGETAFMLQAWSGVYAQANDENLSSVVGEIEVAPFAPHDEGENTVVLSLPEAMAISKFSKHKAAAWEFIRYMSSHEFDKEKTLALGTLPIWTDLFGDEKILSVYPFFENFGKQISYSVGFPNVEWNEELCRVTTSVGRKIISGSVGIREGLVEMQRQCKKVAGVR